MYIDKVLVTNYNVHIPNREEVKAMSKKKKKGNHKKISPTEIIILVTAIIQLIEVIMQIIKALIE